jgi:LysM repeat protein
MFRRARQGEREMKRFFILMLVLLLITGCDLFGGENEVPAPVVVSTPEPVSTEDISPRTGPADGLPPTWTPESGYNETPLGQSQDSGTVPGEVDPAGRQTYEVQAGDSLAAIAIQFQVPLDELARVNNIQDLDHIETGTILIIPNP